MTKKSAPVKTKIVNESKLVLPQDIGGFSVNFRREAARSIGRIMADEKKLDCFLELLDVFGQYAKDRYEHQLTVRADALKAKAEALKEAQAKALRDADSIVAGKRAHAEKLLAEIAIHDAKMEKSK